METTLETTIEQTVPGSRLTTPEAVKNFVFAGNAYLTIRSAKTGERYTYRVSQSKKSKKEGMIPFYFVSLLSGQDNTNSYLYIGVIDAKGFRTTDNSRLPSESTPVKAFSWMITNLLNNKIHDQLEIWHEGKCGRCGRMLTVPESIEAGIGPECIKFRRRS